MVRMKYKPHTLRPAIAMIELVFALVIIGITLLSAPLILNQSIQSSYTAMQQESIAAASSQISLILTKAWDEQDSNGTFGILQVSNSGDNELNITNRDTAANRAYQVGNPFATAPAALGFDNPQDGTISDDVDDFNGQVSNLVLYTAGEVADIKKNEGEYVDKRVQMTNTVVYGTDAANYANNPLAFNNPFNSAPNSTNIKLINVTLTSQELDIELQKTVSLSAFVCNIGNAARSAAAPVQVP